jgi:chemotaxis protein CheD
MRVHVSQAQFQISADPHVVLVTTLGSCVSACLYDPQAGMGGMNHFLLPEGDDDGPGAVRYGAYAMEVLINNLLSVGARRDRMEAKLFGGGHLFPGLADLGAQNVAFATDFLEREGIRLVGAAVRGKHARRVEYRPASGRGRVRLLTKSEDVFTRETASPTAGRAGTVELFNTP